MFIDEIQQDPEPFNAWTNKPKINLQEEGKFKNKTANLLNCMIAHVLYRTSLWVDDCKSFACYFTAFFVVEVLLQKFHSYYY
jgi:hypothetical protein